MKAWIKLYGGKCRILGWGSNILITRDLRLPVLKNEIKGIHQVRESGDNVSVKAGGGVVWHELVSWCINKGFGGIENLSLIPGSVGASPIQNIGAYGVELKDVFEELEAINLKTGKKQTFNAVDCKFGYRNSIFKDKLKDRYFIINVTLRLSKKPRLQLDYGSIRDELDRLGIPDPSIRDVGRVVEEIRRKKLPDTNELGNAGSFFKNPVISERRYKKLKSKLPVYYALPGKSYKIPAAWLIDQCGWKGKKSGHTGCYKNQALIIVNYGGATGKEIKAFSEKIQASVYKKFSIKLETEVNFW